MSKYKVFETANGQETSETEIEASCYTEALEKALEMFNIKVEATD